MCVCVCTDFLCVSARHGQLAAAAARAYVSGRWMVDGVRVHVEVVGSAIHVGMSSCCCVCSQGV